MHLTDSQVTAYLSGVAGAEAAEHLAQCEDCREELEAAEELDTAFRDAGTWQQADALAAQPPRLGEMLARKAAIARENADAARRLHPLLASPLRFEDANITENPRFRTAGMVRMLCTKASELHDRWPKFSAELADAAYTIALHLDDVRLSSKRLLVAVALRERANARRYLGKFSDALKDLDDAERLFSAPADAATAPLDLAIVAYIRSVIFIQYDESTPKAIDLARRAAYVFHEYADAARELKARLIEAGALHYLHRPAEALAVFDELLAAARRLDQKTILAYVLQNSAIACSELGRLEDAESRFAEAVALYDELGVTTEKVRIAWALAALPMARGDLRQAERALAAARDELLQLGSSHDHALATLEWAEVRLALDRPEGVPEACRSLIVEFESEGMMRNARLALAYLHEALAKKNATPELVRKVRKYLEILPRRPQLAFSLTR
jgi:tetratricopeptide (TPR) repeat protein